MLKPPIYIFILAGGYGKRLFPLSTPQKPKQFLDVLAVGKSLYQQTLERALTIAKPENIYTITGKTHYNHAVVQAMEVAENIVNNIIIEPEPKNTAHSVLMGLNEIANGSVVVMPSDHYIGIGLEVAVNKALGCLSQEKIITFGISPTSADENFGYLLDREFIEKPSTLLASELIKQGALWNSGIFVFDADVMRAEYNKYYNNEPISFDKAIMEKTDKLAVIKANFEWQDLGNFEAIDRIKSQLLTHKEVNL